MKQTWLDIVWRWLEQWDYYHDRDNSPYGHYTRFEYDQMVQNWNMRED